MIFGKIKKTHLQQLPIPLPNLLAIGKIDPRADKYAHVSITPISDERMWERLRSRIGFLTQMYKREGKYKIG